MIRPEGMEPRDGAGTRRSRLAGMVATVALVATVAIVTSRLDAPSGQARSVPATTSTSVVAQRAEPLEWERSATLGEVWPMAVVDHDGYLYFFGTNPGPMTSGGHGRVLGWVSPDEGVTWQSIGVVIPDAQELHSIVSTPLGLMALGGSEWGSPPTLLVSGDGHAWEPVALPIDGTTPEGAYTFLHAAGGTDDLLVVFGSWYFDLRDRVAHALPEALRSRDGSCGGHMAIGGPPLRVTVFAPLGIGVYFATGEELGLDDEVASSILGVGPPQGVTLWASSDGGASWSVSEMDLDHVARVDVTSSGDLMVAGNLRYGAVAVWTSTDLGVTWQPLALPAGAPESVTPWRDGLVGSRWRGDGAHLVHSAAGAPWESFGVERLLPDGPSWYPGLIAAGAGGIAAIVDGHQSEPAIYIEPEPFVIEHGDIRVMADYANQVLLVTDSGVDVLRLSLHGHGVHDDVAVDCVDQTMTFLDPETREPIVTLTFSEIEEAEEEAESGRWQGVNMSEYHQAVVFSSDGAAWSVQDPGAIAGGGRHVRMLHVGEGRLVAVLSRVGARWSWDDPAHPPDLEVWTARIP